MVTIDENNYRITFSGWQAPMKYQWDKVDIKKKKPN